MGNFGSCWLTGLVGMSSCSILTRWWLNLLRFNRLNAIIFLVVARPKICPGNRHDSIILLPIPPLLILLLLLLLLLLGLYRVPRLWLLRLRLSQVEGPRIRLVRRLVWARCLRRSLLSLLRPQWRRLGVHFEDGRSIGGVGRGVGIGIEFGGE